MCFAPQRRALFRHFFDIWASKSGPRPSVFNTFDLEMCFAPQRRALFRHRNFQKWSENGVFCTFWLRNVLRATTACAFSTSQLPKVVRRWGVLHILTWKCASRHNGVHFFDISTSKSGPTLRCFVHFDLEMCFAPQRRALFRHLNFQKWSDAEVFCTFWLGNVLRATTACTFSTSQLPKVVRTPGVLYILTWKCASRHNGVQFFIAPVASWLRTRRFSEPTFRPSWATNHWKNTVFRDFPTFSRICIFCPLTLSLLIFSLPIFLFSVPLPCSAFHLSILSEVWLLNFLRPGSGMFRESTDCSRRCAKQMYTNTPWSTPIRANLVWKLSCHVVDRMTQFCLVWRALQAWGSFFVLSLPSRDPLGSLLQRSGKSQGPVSTRVLDYLHCAINQQVEGITWGLRPQNPWSNRD